MYYKNKMEFETVLKKYKLNEISSNALEDAWYSILHSKPGKRTERRVFQQTFSSHPVCKSFGLMKAAAPKHVKPAITCCLKYSKQWWSKATDTYLFPSFAVTLFLQSAADSGYVPIPSCTKENALNLYNHIVNATGPDDFTQYIVCSDQHTSAGAYTRDTPYAAPLFAMWGSVVRPTVLGHEYIFKEYIKLCVPHMPDEYVDLQAKAMVRFGRGDMSEECLWRATVDTVKSGLGLLGPPMPKLLNNKCTYDDSVKHPNPKVKFHFRYSIMPGLWPTDVVVSGLQKMIRRARLGDALWMTSQLLCFALFHKEVNDLWTIFAGAQAKVTNLLNRILVIVAEDCYPDASLFVAVAANVERSRKVLFDLKDAQTQELYMERFSIICSYVMATVTVLVAAPKARVVDTRMRMFGKHYKQAEQSMAVESKKRKQMFGKAFTAPPAPNC